VFAVALGNLGIAPPEKPASLRYLGHGGGFWLVQVDEIWRILMFVGAASLAALPCGIIHGNGLSKLEGRI